MVGVGAALEQNCRPAAVIARIGGEEFVVVDTAGTPEHADITETMRQAIADLPFPITAAVALDQIPTPPDVHLIDALVGTRRHRDVRGQTRRGQPGLSPSRSAASRRPVPCGTLNAAGSTTFNNNDAHQATGSGVLRAQSSSVVARLHVDLKQSSDESEFIKHFQRNRRVLGDRGR
ncbi:GGDEF domain-containing protein [Mycobacterium tilburgii]|uniref:GGDEF domain-containing protein n=1 Tax=Mycobacterium tilburgii TaxID=44467 RepID=UPI001183A2CF